MSGRSNADFNDRPRLWDDRLAEIWAWPGKTGAGVVLGSAGVLTAWHVVEAAAEHYETGRILARVVRRGGALDDWVAMRLVVDDANWDLAVLEVDRAAVGHGSWTTPASATPVIAMVGTAVEDGCEAVGFPDVDVQHPAADSGPAQATRNTEQVSGSLKPMGQVKHAVAPHRRLPAEWMPLDATGPTPDAQTGWAGMSGAGVVLPDGRLVGVVVDAEAGFQQRRLYVVPLGTSLATSPRLRDALTQVTGRPMQVQPRYTNARQSAYLQQVQRIAPAELIGRTAELEALAAFCTLADQPQYSWWRAPAWAGKSALMSWFVLHPPPGVRVVSFFVTARYAGQSDRAAFIDVMLEQLADLLGRQVPAHLTEATRDGHLLGMLAEAAQLSAQYGERFVLVVDGLDEDRGVVTGPDAYSIVGMLPVRPPAGMRIIVSGRPNPPMPPDVPEDHPLRDPANVRSLHPSSYARVVRSDMERELDRLLGGAQAEQDLLGLVAAAVGGLSGMDLAELTGLSVRQIEVHLHRVAGRSFTRRTSVWHPDAAPAVYVLGHDELQQTAVEFLGDRRLEDYRQRLHRWADQYRGLGWPSGTPEYLLRGYYRMLRLSGDLSRMITCATDFARHSRLLDLSGGDAAAMDEVLAALDLMLDAGRPDFAVVARLAVHRDVLAERNANVPTSLPAVWACVGHSMRAIAVANAISGPDRRAAALTDLAGVLAVAGQLDLAAQAAAQAEISIRSIAPADLQLMALADLTRVLVAAGLADQTARLATLIGELMTAGRVIAYWAVQAVVDLAEALGRSGERTVAQQLAYQVESIVDAVPPDTLRLSALIGLARAFALTGAAERAVALADRSAAMLDVVTDPDARARALQQYMLREVTEPAYVRAGALTDAEWDLRARTFADLAVVRVAAADVVGAWQLADRAERAARAIADPDRQARALIGLLRVSVVAPDRKVLIARRAEALAHEITVPDRRAQTLLGLLQAATGVLDDVDHLMVAAESAALMIVDPERSAAALADLARAMAAAYPEWGRRLALRGAAAVRAITDPVRRLRAETNLAGVLAATGELDAARKILSRAEAFARAVTDPHAQVEALIDIVRASATIHDAEAVCRHADQAEALLSSIINPLRRWNAEVVLAGKRAAVGDLSRAHTLIDRNDASTVRGVDPDDQAHALAWLMRVVAETSDVAATRQVLDRLGLRVLVINAPHWRAQACGNLARAFAAVGDTHRSVELLNMAERVVRAINDPYRRAETLAQLAAAALPDRERTVRLAVAAVTAARTISDPASQAEIVAGLAGMLPPENLLSLPEIDRLEAEVRKLNDPLRYARALGALAQIFDHANPKGLSRRVLGEALRAGPLTMVLEALAKLEPEAVAAAVAEFSVVAVPSASESAKANRGGTI